MNILHVDDAMLDRELVKAQLERLDSTLVIDEASSSEEALHKIAEKTYDCVLSDYQMPVASGLDLLIELRKGGTSIPFIFLTGQGSERIASMALREGADDYFTKEMGFAHYVRLLNSIKKSADAFRTMKEKRLAQEDLEQTRHSLEILRSLNRIISSETHVHRMFSSVCDMLQEKCGYQYVLLATVTDDYNPLHVVSSSRQPARLQNMADSILTEGFPGCMTQAAKTMGTIRIEDTRETCGSCPFAAPSSDMGAYCTALRAGSRILGYFLVSLPRYQVHSAREKKLYEECADDISVALGRFDREHLMVTADQTDESVSLSDARILDETVVELTKTLVLGSELNDIGTKALKSARRLTGSDEAFIGFIDKKKREMICPVSGSVAGACEACVVPEASGTGVGLCRQFQSEMSELLTREENEATARPAPYVKRSGEAHIAIIPIHCSGMLAGMLCVKKHDSNFHGEELNKLVRIAELFSLAAERVSLQERLRKQHELLEEQNIALSQTNENLETFAYTVSHDLQAPIRQVSDYIELIDEALDNGDISGVRQMSRSILRISRRMSCLVNDILEFSRINAADMAAKEINVSALCGDIRDNLTSESGRQVHFEIEPGMRCRGNKALIRQLFQNLMENAVKYSRASPKPFIAVGTTKKRGRKTFFVRDNGTGFDTARSDELFKPFTRLHADDQYGGFGLGLSIVKKIVDRHNGSIWADGRPGKGATFYIHLDADNRNEDVISAVEVA